MSEGKKKEYEVNGHQLSVSSLSLLYKLFRDNKIEGNQVNKIAKILAWSTLTQPLHLIQKAYIYPKLKTVNFDKTPPVFVIGHWRSGTTHLHYMLSRDPQFGYLTNYQGLFMRMSFLGNGIMDKIVDYYMPETRPQDNIKMGAYEPAEEEQPLTNLTECSGMQAFYFPKNQSYYDKYNLFKGISDKEKKEWQKHYTYLLKLISLANENKPLVLKNPHNTGRVKELLELYPNAKFIFIHRDPIDVYHSTMHLFKKMVRTQFFQEFSDEETSERIIYAYRTTLQKYLKDRDLIPDNHLVEISYNDLEQNPIETLSSVYRDLNIGGFESAKEAFIDYLNSTSDYKRNKFVDLDEKLLNRLKKEWSFAFEEWDYLVPN